MGRLQDRRNIVKRQAHKKYEEGGQSAVFDFINNFYSASVNWEYCKPCECISPTLKEEHECLVCGSETKTITMNTYVILHTHKFGSTPYVFKSKTLSDPLNKSQLKIICKHFDIDYEPDYDDLELISILENEDIPEIKFRL